MRNYYARSLSLTLPLNNQVRSQHPSHPLSIYLSTISSYPSALCDAMKGVAELLIAPSVTVHPLCSLQCHPFLPIDDTVVWGTLASHHHHHTSTTFTLTTPTLTLTSPPHTLALALIVTDLLDPHRVRQITCRSWEAPSHTSHTSHTLPNTVSQEAAACRRIA